MTGARLKALTLATAVLFAVLGGGAPRILCVGPGGHAAVEETLCGRFETGISRCPSEGASPLALSGPLAPFGTVEESGDDCIDTVLQARALSASPRVLAAPGDCPFPPAAIFAPGAACPKRPTPGHLIPRHDPPIPFDTRTTLLI